MNTLETFILLYFCNLVLDYPLQGTFLAKEKSNSNYLLFVHSAIWGLGLSVVLMPLELFSIWKVLFLVGGHYLIDYLKCRGKYPRWIADNHQLYIDQFLHILQLLVVL